MLRVHPYREHAPLAAEADPDQPLKFHDDRGAGDLPEGDSLTVALFYVLPLSELRSRATRRERRAIITVKGVKIRVSVMVSAFCHGHGS